MIIWGGSDSINTYFDTGGRYNPNTDTWTAISITNAPTGRYHDTAAWTGNEMIVWGGRTLEAQFLTPAAGIIQVRIAGCPQVSTNVPVARFTHTAVWTGTDMIVWGGVDYVNGYFNTGAKYDPGTDSWTTTSVANVPDARAAHTAIWTGTQMIIWGGEGDAADFQIIPAAGIIRSRIVGQPRTLPARLMAGTITERCGPAPR